MGMMNLKVLLNWIWIELNIIMRYRFLYHRPLGFFFVERWTYAILNVRNGVLFFIFYFFIVPACWGETGTDVTSVSFITSALSPVPPCCWNVNVWKLFFKTVLCCCLCVYTMFVQEKHGFDAGESISAVFGIHVFKTGLQTRQHRLWPDELRTGKTERQRGVGGRETETETDW